MYRFLSIWFVFFFTSTTATYAQSILYDFSGHSFDMTYNQWAGKESQQDGRLVISSASGGGGLVNTKMDFSAYSDTTPVLQLELLGKHTEDRLNLIIKDADGTSANWRFNLTKVKSGQMTIIHSESLAKLSDAAAISKPGEQPGLDLSQIVQMQLTDSFQPNRRIEIVLAAILTQADTPLIISSRQAAQEQKAVKDKRAADRKVKEQARQEAFAKRVKGSKALFVDLTTARDSILVVHFNEGWVDHSPGGKEYDDPTRLHQYFLDVPAAELPQTWVITSKDDPDYLQPTIPVKIGRKSRGSDFLRKWMPSLDEDLVRDHWIYLELPKPLKAGKTYQIDLSSLALNEGVKSFRFDPQSMRSESVHVNQLGYVPDAPVKYGYVSHFMGSLGRLELKQGELRQFHLIDQANGAIAFTGELKFRKDFETGGPDAARPAGEDGPNNNQAGSDVWECDFSTFSKPGDYVLAVEGIGCSYHFQIRPDVYRQAWYTVARQLYHQRSGVDKGPPYTRWKFPREHHPDDGFTALLPDGTKYTTWGWYQDAGDWDPYVHHSRVAVELLFAYELAPQNFSDGELNIPESGNGIPDILDSAAWQVNFMRRSIGPNGGVIARMDFGSSNNTGGPSWEDKTTWRAMTESPESSFRFASIAAQLAYCLDLSVNGTHPDTKGLLKDARHQYEWAVNQYKTEMARLPQLKQQAQEQLSLAEKLKSQKGKKSTEERLKQRYAEDFADYVKDLPGTPDVQVFAAASLYKATGELGYLEDFKALNRISNVDAPLIQSGKTGRYNQEWSTWTMALINRNDKRYQNLDTKLLDVLASAACMWSEKVMVETAEKRGFRNGYEWTMPHVTGNATTPVALPAMVAYHLSRDTRHLAAIYTAADFCLGGNPMNMLWVSGIGHRSPRQLHHLNSMYLGLEEMVPGIVPYGPKREGDRGNPWFDGPWDNDFGRNSAYPYHKLWPITELYFENRYNPQGNEFTVHQNIAPAAAVYGYLSGPAQKDYQPNHEPQVSFVDPPENGKVGEPLILYVQANDTDGRVLRVEFYDGKMKLGESTIAPFTFSYPRLQAGVHQISAIAYDNQGARTFSTDRPRITVDIK